MITAMIKDKIIKVLAEVSDTPAEKVGLELTDNPSFGDYSTNVALILAKEKGIKPRDLAEEFAGKLRENDNLKSVIEKIEVAGPGFINFWLKNDVLFDNLMQIASEKEKYGTSDWGKGNKYMFEFAHPNTHKAFHIGHLRNITTGESLSRFYEAVGYEVIRVNYQGDVGLHIAKTLYGIEKIGFTDPKDTKARAEYLGKAYAAGSKAYEEDEGAKKEIHEINGKIYKGSDPEVNKLYKETRSWSLEYFAEIYKRVGTKFDRLYFESEVAESGKEISVRALKDGILERSKGAVIFPGSKYGLHDRVFITGEDVPTYEGKELGLGKLQFDEYTPDMIVHCVGPEQAGYFQVLFKALEMIFPETKGKELHVPYGWVKLKNGKMSSRTGQVVLGEWLLDEAKKKLLEIHKMKDGVAEQVAVGAVKYSFLKTGLTQELAFDLNESISIEGNSGPYLQYTAARANSVLCKAEFPISNFQFPNKLKIKNLKLKVEEESVLRSLSRFSEVISMSAKMYSPNLLCNFLYDLAQKFNGFYNKDKIIGSDNEDFRLALTFGVGQVLKNGLNLLGIQAPERM